MSEKSLLSGSLVWYQVPAAGVMESLEVDSSGLKSAEVKARLTKYGYNELKFRKRGALIRFLLQFHSPLIYVLLAATIVTAFLNMWIECG